MIRILLADEHRVVSDCLKMMLQETGELDVVGQAADGEAALELVRKLLPDMVVMEIAMPLVNGVEAAYTISQDYPRVKVLCLTRHSGGDYVRRMLGAGAKGYLPKDCLPEELLAAIRSVAAGGVYISPSVAQSVIDGYVRGRGADEGAARLTRREKRILQLLSEGKTTAQIGMCLHVSGKTAAAGRRSIARKLRIDSVAKLTKYAIRHGLSQETL